MTRLLKTIILVIAVLMVYIAEGADWTLLVETPEESYYYDKESITYPSKGIIRVWGRELREAGERNNLIEINCEYKEFRILSFTDYDENGEVSGESTSPTGWESIAKESPSELLYKALCEDKIKP